jgi:hypothetical protein
MMWLSGLALMAGCRDDNASTATSKPTPAAVPIVAARETPAEVDTAAAKLEPQAPVEAGSPPATSDAAPVIDAAAVAEEPKEKRPTPERIAILTPGGPLLVDVRITIGDEPYVDSFQSLLKAVLDAGDSNDDGESTWKELVADRKYFEKEMQNAPAEGSRQMKTLIERYDENRDGKIQPAEAASWLGRDAGGSAKAFAVRSTRSYRPVPRATSQLWHLIDADADGQLTKEEIAAAPRRLLAFDADDDRVLAPTEMASLREQLEAAGQQRMSVRRDPSHYAAMHLQRDTNIDRLQYLLSDLYSPQQDLGPGSFSQLADWYKKLDASNDGWFSGEELADMVSIEPHVEIAVNFEPASDNTKPGTAAMEPKLRAPEVTLVTQPSSDRAILAIGNTRVILSAHNLATKPAAEATSSQMAAQKQVRLMVHDQSDAVFQDLDANADGRLGEREIAFCAQRLAERDRNHDGTLAGDEFPYSMIAAFLLAEAANEQSFYVPPVPVSDGKGGTSVPPWFTHGDLNADGDVSRREFVGSPEQFDRLDADNDGYIAPAESAL